MKKKTSPFKPILSPVSLGLWRLHEWEMDTGQLRKYIEYCIEAGITTFDHADIYGDYGNEGLFGKVLKEAPGLRSQMQLVSKTGICLTTDNRPEHKIQHYNTSKSYINASVERSLKELRAETLDLLLIHRPDPLMDCTELADTFSGLIDRGLIRSAGVSNFTPSQFEMLQSRMDDPLHTNQVECSLLHTDPIYDGTFDQAQEFSFRPMIWSPFAGGRLFHEESDAARRLRSVLHELAEKYSAGTDQIALSWLHALPCKPVTVIGTGRIDRARAAADAVQIELDKQDWFRLLKASRGHDVA